MPKPDYDLTDAEKRDLIHLIQEGKNLPEKYRFLLFPDKRAVELAWNGKTREVCTTVLPFQSLEPIDEPRKEAPVDQLTLLDVRGRQQTGWTNKLIWGDNKLILSSLKSGALRKQIEDAGGLRLIYIDPPFDVGADFLMDIEIGDETFHKEPGILEQIAYRDTWGRGADSFISMIYERLILMRDLLADDGFIVVHMGDRVSAIVKSAIAEVFGEDNYRNTIIIPRGIKNVQAQFSDVRGLSVGHDTLLFFSKSNDSRVSKLSLPGTQASPGKWDTFWRGTNRHTMRYTLFGITPSTGQWRWSEERARQAETNYNDFLSLDNPETMDDYYHRNLDDGLDLDFIRLGPNQSVQYYVPPRDYKLASTLWAGIRTRGDVTEYATEKHEELVSILISWLSRPDDLVADFFCGSGTTAVVSENLGRRWICTDIGKFAIHTTRKRLIQAQREMKAAGKPFRAFEVLNLGRYERQAYLSVGGRLSGKQREEALAQKESEFRDLILRAYKAQPLEEAGFFHGRNAGRLVVIGPINLPVGRLFVEEVITECRKRGASRADILAFEFEMGLFPAALDEARQKGIDLAPKYIPAQVFDKRAVEKGQVVFHDISYIEAQPRYDAKDKLTLQVELTDFSVYYNQGAAETAIAAMKEGKSDVVCDNGKLIKVTKDKFGVVTKEVLTKLWSDWVDYWAVDFDYMSRKEIIQVSRSMGIETNLPGMDPPQAVLEEFEERWTGGYIFENEWQSFRTRKNRTLEFTSSPHTYPRPGRYTVAVKVIDIFGNDTMTLVPVNVG